MTYEQFKNKYNGKYVDYDKYYGPQCWDLGQYYMTEVLGLPTYILSGCGLVSNMLIQPKRAVLDEFFNEVRVDQMHEGDIVIWDYGHIAIYDHWDGQSCWFFSQNPGPCKVQKIDIRNAYAFRKKEKPKHNIGYRAQLQDYGWQDWVFDGDVAGTTGEARRLEAIQIDYDGEIYAKAHMEGYGWVDYGKINKDTVIGTVGEYRRLECLCLKGNFKYRVHLEGSGWSCWTNADGISTLGSVGQCLRIEAIQILEL